MSCCREIKKAGSHKPGSLMLHHSVNGLRESELTLELCTERSEMQGKEKLEHSG